MTKSEKRVMTSNLVEAFRAQGGKVTKCPPKGKPKKKWEREWDRDWERRKAQYEKRR